jgi:hypothetical protein
MTTRTWRRGAALVMLAAVVLTPRLSAFNYEEHRDLSNEALARAVRYIREQHPGCGTCLDTVLVLAGEKHSAFGSRTASFGDLAALVDYTTHPWELLHRRGFHPSESPGGLHLLDLDNVKKLRGEVFRLLHASNLDHNHFQNNAMVAYFTWHHSAVSLAALRDGPNPPDLDRALVTEAYALHFLEDFFAPGHVFTPRETLHAIASMSLHDRFNREPVEFLVNGEKLRDLGPFFCDRELFDRLSSSERKAVTLLGDGSLFRGEGKPRPRNHEQAEFMAAVLARSVADVLETWLCATDRVSLDRCAVNSFLDWTYTPYRLNPDGGGSFVPRLEIAFGRYEEETPRPNPVIGAAREGPAAYLSTIYSVQAGFDAVHGREATTGRYRLEVEWIPLGSPGRHWREGRPRVLQFQNIPQFGLGLRYSHTAERGAKSDGLGARLVLPVPLVDLQLSLAGDYRRYRGDLTPAWRLDWEAKLEFGYGVIFAGVGVGRVHHRVDPGRLETGWALSASLTLMKPHTLVQKIFARDRGASFPAKCP